MPEIHQIVDFLDREQCLRLGEDKNSPPSDNSDIYEVDWDEVFRTPEELNAEDGAGRGDRWPDRDRIRDILGPLVGQAPESSLGSNVPVLESHGHFCAWYQAIHYHAYDFGIFIRQDCVLKWAGWVARFIPKGTPVDYELFRRLMRAALYVLFLHEHCHHKVESLGFRLHVSKGKSCYLPYKCQAAHRFTR